MNGDVLVIDALMQENIAMKVDIASLNAQLKDMTEVTSDSTQVCKLARDVKKNTGANIKVFDLTQDLQTTFDAIANAKTTGHAKKAISFMGAAAKDQNFS